MRELERPYVMKKGDVLIILTGIVVLRALVSTITFIWFDFGAHPHEDTFSIWHRWDAHQYERIAEHGYAANGLNTADHQFLSRFPPLYPALCRLLGALTGLPFQFTGPATSLTALVLASLLLFQLTLSEYKSRRFAYQSVILLNCFPTAYFGQTALTESLFILLLVGIFYSIRIKEWYLLGWLLSGLGILTRTVGVTFILPSLTIVIKKLLTGTLQAQHLWGIAFPVCALLLVFYCNYTFYGNPLMFFQDYQNTSHSIKSASYPFADLFQQIRTLIFSFPSIFSDESFMFHQGWGAILSTMCAITLLVGRSRIALEYHVFSWGYFLFLHNTTWAISMPRYLWVLFPVVLILGQTKNVSIFTLVTTLSLAFQLYFAIRFTSGAWGF